MSIIVSNTSLSITTNKPPAQPSDGSALQDKTQQVAVEAFQTTAASFSKANASIPTANATLSRFSDITAPQEIDLIKDFPQAVAPKVAPKQLQSKTKNTIVKIAKWTGVTQPDYAPYNSSYAGHSTKLNTEKAKYNADKNKEKHEEPALDLPSSWHGEYTYIPIEEEPFEEEPFNEELEFSGAGERSWSRLPSPTPPSSDPLGFLSSLFPNESFAFARSRRGSDASIQSLGSYAYHSDIMNYSHVLMQSLNNYSSPLGKALMALNALQEDEQQIRLITEDEVLNRLAPVENFLSQSNPSPQLTADFAVIKKSLIDKTKELPKQREKETTLNSWKSALWTKLLLFIPYLILCLVARSARLKQRSLHAEITQFLKYSLNAQAKALHTSFLHEQITDMPLFQLANFGDKLDSKKVVKENPEKDEISLKDAITAIPESHQFWIIALLKAPEMLLEPFPLNCRPTIVLDNSHVIYDEAQKTISATFALTGERAHNKQAQFSINFETKEIEFEITS